MIHMPECDEYNEKQKKAIEEYEDKWPKHCDNCGGAGGFYFQGTFYQPPDYDPCEKCLGKGLCPRCGAETFMNDEEDVCSSCQFSLKDGIGKPEMECICDF